ncbi:MAG: hypothetical protein N2112_07110 [Gemmataceae bacterium]|jgi:hypothetical protein|nr:hypothetical protein [Gemmataceae bacterium]
MAKGFAPRTGQPLNKKFLLLCGLGLMVILLGSALPQLFLAEPALPAEKVVAAEQTPQTLSALFGKLFLGTLLIVGVGALASWYFAKKNRQVPKASANETMALLGKLPVGRGMVYYVRIKNHRVIAAVDNTGFRSLTQIPVPVLPPPSTEMPSQPAPYVPQTAPTFLEVLKQQQP